MSFAKLKSVPSWLNTLYLSMDANFKLKQKERGFNDPPLSNGLAFMVPADRLQMHLADCVSKKLMTEVCDAPPCSLIITHLR